MSDPAAISIISSTLHNEGSLTDHYQREQHFPRHEALLHVSADSNVVSSTKPSNTRESLVDLYASILFSKRFLFSSDTLLNCAVTVLSTVLCYFYLPQTHFSLSMSWRLLSVTLILPMITSTQIVFDRRELALQQIRMLRGRAYQLYQAHASWAPIPPGSHTFPDSNGMYWLAHSDRVLHQLIQLGRDMHRYLTLPTWTRTRHRVTFSGQEESKQITRVSRPLYETNLLEHIQTLAQATEVLKRSGLELPETIRIRDWERMLSTTMEQLRLIKTYTSPQALGSFGRVYTFVLPPLYGPSYIKLVRHFYSSVDPRGEIWMGICFALIVAYTATALLEMNQDLEDPFVSNFDVDTIDVNEELVTLLQRELLGARKELFPYAPVVSFS